MSTRPSATSEANERPDYDPELQAIADYVLNYQVGSQEALETGSTSCGWTLAVINTAGTVLRLGR